MNTIKTNPTASVGFLIGMGAWSICFITLIWGYIVYRLRLGQWLAGYVNESVFEKAMINTGVLMVSTWCLHHFLQKKRNRMFAFGVILGIFFLKGQWNLWTVLLARGLTFNTSMAGSFLYLLTGFHAAHIVIALMILLPFGIKLCQVVNCEGNQRRFEFALRFWDLLMWFWVVLLLLIFVFK